MKDANAILARRLAVLLFFFRGMLKWPGPELLLRVCRRVNQFAINTSALSARPAQRINNSVFTTTNPFNSCTLSRTQGVSLSGVSACKKKIKTQTDKWREGDSQG